MARIRDLGINVIPGAGRDNVALTPAIMNAEDLFACGENSATDDDERGGGCGAQGPCTHTGYEGCDEQNNCTHTGEDGECDEEGNCSHTGEDEECDDENGCSHTGRYDDECDQTCSHTGDRPDKPTKRARALGADAIAQLTQQLENHLARELEN